MIQSHAIRLVQKDLILYLSSVCASNLLSHVQVDYWSPDNPTGYQRPLEDKRLRGVADYLFDEIGVLPTSVLLSARGSDVLFEVISDHMKSGQIGKLSIADGVILWVVDGQHRLFGLERAFHRDAHGWTSDYPVPVTIVTMIDRYSEMSLFNIVNTRQKGVPADIVDQHLSRMVIEEGADFIPTKGMKPYLRGRASNIVGMLNQMKGPWLNKLKIPGIDGMDIGIVRYHTVVASLEPVFSDAWISARPDQDIAILLNNYWSALGKIMPFAFEDPLQYRIQVTPGVYVLHILFPKVIHVCAGVGRFDVNTMEKVLRYTHMTSQFWHKVHGDYATMASDMRSIRRLASDLSIRLAGPRTIIA